MRLTERDTERAAPQEKENLLNQKKINVWKSQPKMAADSSGQRLMKNTEDRFNEKEEKTSL